MRARRRLRHGFNAPYGVATLSYEFAHARLNEIEAKTSTRLSSRKTPLNERGNLFESLKITETKLFTVIDALPTPVETSQVKNRAK